MGTLNHALLIFVLGTTLYAQDEVRFSPKGGAQDLVVRAIDSAKTEICLAAYQLTNPAIGIALARAAKRGVSLRIVVDRTQPKARASLLPALKQAKIPVRVDRRHKIMHHKVVIIDGRHLVTGSFNFSTSAELVNAENCVLLRDSTLVNEFRRDFQTHWQHAEPFSP